MNQTASLAHGPAETFGAGSATVLGRRKAGDGDEPDAEASPAAGRSGVGGGASGPDSPPSGAEDVDEDEEPRDILAICKHGDKLGVAAVGGATICFERLGFGHGLAKAPPRSCVAH